MALLGGKNTAVPRQKRSQDDQGVPVDSMSVIVLKDAIGLADALNSRLKMIKIRSRGFRNQRTCFQCNLPLPWRLGSLSRRGG